MIITLAVCGVWLRRRIGKGSPRLRGRRAARLLLSPRYWLSPSHRLDLLLMLGNLQAFGLLLGWAVISHGAVRAGVAGALSGWFGAMPISTLPPLATGAVATVLLFVTYELAYWLDHYLSHSIPALWAFHKVHHSAQVLSPLTNFRVHPVESVKFANIIAVLMGVSTGVLDYGFGRRVEQFGLLDINLILVAFSYATVQLQHSHVWMTFRGPLGWLVLSPAHHQIHHSADPAHFNKNLGSCTTLFDRLFGFHLQPGDKRQRLTFGLGAEQAAPHTLSAGLVGPFVEAARRLAPARTRGLAPLTQ